MLELTSSHFSKRGTYQLISWLQISTYRSTSWLQMAWYQINNKSTEPYTQLPHDVIITSLWRYYYVMCPLGCDPQQAASWENPFPWVWNNDNLTHLHLVPHIYASVNRVSISSDNGLSPIRRHTLSKPTLVYCQLDPWGLKKWNSKKKSNVSFKTMRLKMSFSIWRPFFPGRTWVDGSNSTRNREISQALDTSSDLFCQCKICHAVRQQCCPGACQILELHGRFRPESHSFERSWRPKITTFDRL